MLIAGATRTPRILDSLGKLSWIDRRIKTKDFIARAQRLQSAYLSLNNDSDCSLKVLVKRLGCRCCESQVLDTSISGDHIS